MAYRHVSAMMHEVMACLACRPGGIYADCTLGGAGHARAICEQIGPDGHLIGVDQDIDAIANAKEVLKPFASSIHLFHGNFTGLPNFLAQVGIEAVDGILLDLGLSQHQLESSGRGFTFQKDEPLDMRMDMRSEKRADDLVNQLPERELALIFQQYGEERWSKRIARAIVSARRAEPIHTTGQLVKLVRRAVPGRAAAQQKIHPATRVFMALRIAVNEELACLDQFLGMGVDLLRFNGRMCVLSFHSLEDRMVKQRFKQWANPCTCPPDLPQCVCGAQPRVRVITKKVVRPSEEEILRNPMARSTRLRCVERVL
jgi:16S rRNA (cytosine1402-N4)-methyltransferase